MGSWNPASAGADALTYVSGLSSTSTTNATVLNRLFAAASPESVFYIPEGSFPLYSSVFQPKGIRVVMAGEFTMKNPTTYAPTPAKVRGTVFYGAKGGTFTNGALWLWEGKTCRLETGTFYGMAPTGATTAAIGLYIATPTTVTTNAKAGRLVDVQFVSFVTAIWGNSTQSQDGDLVRPLVLNGRNRGLFTRTLTNPAGTGTATLVVKLKTATGAEQIVPGMVWLLKQNRATTIARVVLAVGVTTTPAKIQLSRSKTSVKPHNTDTCYLVGAVAWCLADSDWMVDGGRSVGACVIDAGGNTQCVNGHHSQPAGTTVARLGTITTAAGSSHVIASIKLRSGTHPLTVTGILPGDPITMTGVTAGTYVTAVTVTNASVTMSAAATATHATETVTFVPPATSSNLIKYATSPSIPSATLHNGCTFDTGNNKCASLIRRLRGSLRLVGPFPEVGTATSDFPFVITTGETYASGIIASGGVRNKGHSVGKLTCLVTYKTGAHSGGNPFDDFSHWNLGATTITTSSTLAVLWKGGIPGHFGPITYNGVRQDLFSGTLATDVTLPVADLETVFTITLPLGKWELDVGMTFATPSAVTEAFQVEWGAVLGTATATFSGRWSTAAQSAKLAVLSKEATGSSIKAVVTVTTAGTILVKATATTHGCKAKAKTPTTLTGASGWVARAA